MFTEVLANYNPNGTTVEDIIFMSEGNVHPVETLAERCHDSGLVMSGFTKCVP